MPDLDTIPRESVAFILNEVEGKPLHVQREILHRWALDRGFTGSLIDEVLFRQPEFKNDLESFRKSQAKATKEKALSDKEWKELCIKEKRWDSVHNCEIPKVNSSDPDDTRFGGTGNKGSKSEDVTWVSQP